MNGSARPYKHYLLYLPRFDLTDRLETCPLDKPAFFKSVKLCQLHQFFPHTVADVVCMIFPRTAADVLCVQCVCVFITARPSTKLFACVGGGYCISFHILPQTLLRLSNFLNSEAHHQKGKRVVFPPHRRSLDQHWGRGASFFRKVPG